MKFQDIPLVSEVIAGLIVAAILIGLSRAYRRFIAWWRTQSDLRQETFDTTVERGVQSTTFQLHLAILVSRDFTVNVVGILGSFLILLLAHIHMQLGDTAIPERIGGFIALGYTALHYIKSTERSQIYAEINRRTEAEAGMPDNYLLS